VQFLKLLIWKLPQFGYNIIITSKNILYDQPFLNYLHNAVSGGCGAMYEIFVQAPDFKGLSVVKQHRLVNEVSKF
jgi:hypothetical protein